MTVPSFTGVWQPGTSFGCIAIVPSGFFCADLDQAHPATRHDRQRRMPAIVRNLDADPLRSLNAIQPLLGAELDRLVVNVMRLALINSIATEAQRTQSKIAYTRKCFSVISVSLW